MFASGPRIGWTVGGLGGMLWLPALALLARSQGQELVAAADMFFLVLGVGYLWILAPWKRPDTRFYYLLGGLFVLLALAGLFNALMLLPRNEWSFTNLWWLGFVLFLIIPGANFGSKTWREMHGERD